jgi:hypothetical protein
MAKPNDFQNPTDPAPGAGLSAGTAAQQAKEEVKSLASDAKQQAAQTAEQAKDYVSQLVDRQKGQAADRLGSVAGALRDTADRLKEENGTVGDYATRAAEQVDKLSTYLRDRDLGTFVRDTETFARRHPDVFLGGTFLAGLLVARFLKSSAERQEWDGRSGADARVSFDDRSARPARPYGGPPEPYNPGARPSYDRGRETNFGSTGSFGPSEAPFGG